MMNITINIQAPELAHAIETLAIAIGCSVDKIGVGQAIQEAVNQKPVVDKTVDKPVDKVETPWINEAEKAPITQETTEETQFTLEEVRKALGDLAKAKGKDIAKGILTQFNVSKVTDLDKSQYNVAMQAIKEA